MERYQWSALANRIFKDPSRGSFVVPAMRKQYHEGFGLEEDDPIINRALAEAAVGLANGQVTNSSVFEAMTRYSERFAERADETSVQELVNYAGFDVPEAIRELIGRNAGIAVSDLDNENEEHAKLKMVLNTLRTSVLEERLYPQLVGENRERTLRAIAEAR